METRELADIFDRASMTLEPEGHRVLIRQTRWLIAEGRLEQAATFAAEVARLMPKTEMPNVSNGLDKWLSSSGDLEELLATPAWIAGYDRENERSQNLRELMESGLPSDSAEDDEAHSMDGEWQEEYQPPTPPPRMPELVQDVQAEPRGLDQHSFAIGVGICLLQAGLIYVCFLHNH